jgi:hypothetical protein
MFDLSSILETLPDIMSNSKNNFRWMLDKYGTLVKEHPNEFVAIDNCKVIDSDKKMEALLKRMNENKSNTTSTIIEFIKEKKLN